MLPVISKREDLLLFYKKLAEEPQGFHQFLESYALDFCNQIEFKWGYIKEQNIHIFAGVGLNGRYALAIAKELSRFTGKKVWVYVYSLEYRLRPEFENLIQELRQIDELNVELFDLAKGLELPKGIRKNDLLIDGLAGYEQDEVFPKPYLDLFEALNNLETIKLSIEVPSGVTFSKVKLDKAYSHIFKADHCWGIAFPSLKMFLADYEPFFGSAKTLNTHQEIPLISKFSLVVEDKLRQSYLETKSIKDVSSKVCIVGGKSSNYGYLLVSGRAALSAGTREVHILTNQEACLPLQMQQAELEVSSFSMEQLEQNTDTVLAICTRLSEELQANFWEQLCSHRQKPLVVGASVTKDLLASKNLLSLVPKESCLVLDINDIPNDELRDDFEQIIWVQKLAQEYGLNFLVVSSRTYVCLANGLVYLQEGKLNSSLAKANLEVLTGLVLALSVQNTQLSIGDRLSLVAYIYREAVTLCQRRRKASIVLSEDIISSISEVFDTLNN